ncbi:MAG: DNA-binding protein [Bacteroidia bacterium]|nr:DNA-binding protein [Bacteroidia bacterium]
MGRSKRQERIKIEVKGIPLRCGHCQHDEFYQRRTLLNTRLFSLLDVDWANRNANCYICTNCGHIEWFLPPKA